MAVRAVRVPSAIRVACGLCAGALALPAVAAAAGALSGGATAPSPAGATGPTGPTGILPTGGTLAVSPDALLEGEPATASGSLPDAQDGGAVLLQVRTKRAWTTVASGLAGAGGTFALSWRSRRAGLLTVRAVSATPSHGDATIAAGATPAATLSVYARVIATW